MTFALQVKSLAHRFGSKEVLRGVSFALAAGELGCLLGPSGCGKTTVLRLIAGFDAPTEGEIYLDGEQVSVSGKAVPPEARKIGMMFQDYALFPHLTVAGNISFGLRHLDPDSRKARLAAMLETVGLTGRAHAYPHELSGGQQQRVALARAIAPQPRLLLLDEPFSNLDVVLREKLALEVREILKKEEITGLLVTHDQFEAFAIADVVGVMTEGVIQQWDSPYNLYHEPHTRFIADFIGQGVFLPGKVLSGDRIAIELGNLASGKASEYEAGAQTLFHTGDTVEVLIRPDDIVHDDDSLLVAEVARKAFRGAEFIYTLRLPSGAQVLALVPSHHNHAVGEKIGIRLEVDHVVAYRR
nr:Spermidine/putrescine import ATP-binding protein PotA [Cupriavidus sp.]